MFLCFLPKKKKNWQEWKQSKNKLFLLGVCFLWLKGIIFQKLFYPSQTSLLEGHEVISYVISLSKAMHVFEILNLLKSYTYFINAGSNLLVLCTNILIPCILFSFVLAVDLFCCRELFTGWSPSGSWKLQSAQTI